MTLFWFTSRTMVFPIRNIFFIGESYSKKEKRIVVVCVVMP